MAGARPFLRSHMPISISSVVATTQDPLEPRTLQVISAYDVAVTTTEKTIWRSGSAYLYPTIASTLSIVSTNASDNASGNGARTVSLVGLDNDLKEIAETIILNGTTPVLTTNTYKRLNSARISTAGTLQKLIGNLSITHTQSGYVIGSIIDGDNKTQHAAFTVPSDRIAMINHINLSVGKAQDCFIKIYFRDPGSVFRLFEVVNMYQQTAILKYEVPFPLRSGIDIEIRALTSAGTASVSASIYLIISGIITNTGPL